MEFNLKNRPKSEDYKPADYGGVVGFANLLGKIKHDYDEWFEGFEKELRAMYATRGRALTVHDEPTDVYLSSYALLKKILGVSE